MVGRFADKFALTSLIVAAVVSIAAIGAGWGVAGAASAREAASAGAAGPGTVALATVRLSELPRQARETFGLIRTGGPFPYEKDGSVFHNRERLLPIQPRGYWREYTVRTPGARDRGARRIVCGGPVRAPHACYYTADHYASFRRITDEAASAP